ncbi:hypothetical protein CPHO_06100 [Corynebacterium phocae]|uniref:Uncharacterized protein n=2 Tax=Corynebacterium phocae TaxID=161895 RepID=A0A1L7D6L4_9CORY|nr:hypothetical protein CPHO_06100 [Corynebacterium phocae]KAA8725209.1 WYL domain-containing protein [Corynebacterium phocae]
MASLTFALLGTAQLKGKHAFRTGEWIQENIPGYPQDGDGKNGKAAFRKQLQRDISTLALAGVPVVFERGTGNTPTKVRIDEERYRLPEVEFTPEEAMVLGLAGGLGQEGGLSIFSQTGWTKMAAAGNSRNFGGPQFAAFNDVRRIKPQDFQALISGVDKRRSISFSYQASPTARAQTRRMDPWGLVPRQGRVYLVGWDLDKMAPRAFRITRVSGVQREAAASDFHAPDRPLAEIVSSFIDPQDLVDALVRIPEDSAVEISSLGHRRDDGLVVIKQVSADWLARTAVGFAPEVEVIEPQSVRESIAALLEKVETNGR